MLFALLRLSHHELELTARHRPKDKSKQQWQARKRHVFKFFGRRRGKTVIMRFRDVIIGVVMSAPKCSQTGSLSVIARQPRNTRLFLFN